jgi:hypothetical protein
MIQCCWCDDWFHYKCMGVTEKDLEGLTYWLCDKCFQLEIRRCDVCKQRIEDPLKNAVLALLPFESKDAWWPAHEECLKKFTGRMKECDKCLMFSLGKDLKECLHCDEPFDQ